MEGGAVKVLEYYTEGAEEDLFSQGESGPATDASRV
jgi:hypothetical protein